MTSIESILKEEGPLLSSTLVRRLETDGVSKEAIRKRLSRLKPPIYKVKGFFVDNQSLFYHQEHINTREYYEGLISAFAEGAQRYYSIVKAIEYHHGYIRKSELASYTFSPVENLKGHKNISNIIDDLVKLKVIVEFEDCYRLTPILTVGNDYKYFKGLELAKDITLKQFYNWARSLNLVSYEKGTFHSEFSKFQWCFVAPSYITSIAERSIEGIKPGFLILDILINDPVTIENSSFFFKKLDAVRNQKVPNIFPFLIVDTVSEDVLKRLKNYGVVVGFVDKIFGLEYAQLLKSVINTLENASDVLKNKPEQFFDLLTQLNKLVDSKTNNLRGDLFELAVGYFYSNKCQVLDIGKKVSHEGKSKEIDVYVVADTHLILAECKGYKSKISVNVIEEWLSEKIPVIYAWVNSQQSLREKKIIFEFWSTGGFTEEALELLQSKIKILKRYNVEYYDQQQILTKARESHSQKFIEIMREYFVKERF